MEGRMASVGKWGRFVNANTSTAAFTVNQRGSGDIVNFQVDGVTLVAIDNSGNLIFSGSIAIDFGDDAGLKMGDGDDADLRYSTQDGNAMMMQWGLPHVDEEANNVAVLALMDFDAVGTDLGSGGVDLSGITQPSLVVLDEDSDSYIRISHRADDEAAIISDGVIHIMPSGDTDDYLTISTVSDVVTLTATGSTFNFVGAMETDAVTLGGTLDADGNTIQDALVGIFGNNEGLVTIATSGTIRAPSVIAGGAGNIAGADLTITPGAGTGTGDVGQVIFKTYQVATAGDNLQTTLETILTLDEDMATFAKGVDIGANALFTTTLRLIERTAGVIDIDTGTNFEYRDLSLRSLNAQTSINMATDASKIDARDTNGAHFVIRARDTDIGRVEIARAQGAADPYLQIGRDDTGVAVGAVCDMLWLQAGSGTNNNSAGFGFGLSVLLGNDNSEVEERASIDFVLVTATNGSEDARIDFNVQGGGTAPARALSILNDSIQVVSSVFITEQVSALTDVAGDGQFWVENLQGTVPKYTGDTGLDSSINRTIFTGTADNENVSSSNELTLVPTGVGTLTIPANTLAVGNTVRIHGKGYYGTKTTGAGTITIRMKLGSVTLTSATHTLDNNLGNDEYWEFTGEFTVRSIGAGGTVMAQSNWEHTSDSPANDEWHQGVTVNTAVSAADTTASLVIDLTSQFSLGDAANEITLTNITVEILN